MKVKEIMTKQPGTYVGVHFNKETKDQLAKFAKDNGVPNRFSRDKIHCTVIYSKKPCPNFETDQSYYPMEGKFGGYDIFQTQDGQNCLVILIDCPELMARNKEITDEHGATSDYDEYHPHITLSYNVGDLDVDKLPDYTYTIVIDHEYYQPLKEGHGNE